MGWREIAGTGLLAMLISACGGAAAAPPTPVSTEVPATSAPPAARSPVVASPAAATATTAAAAARSTATTTTPANATTVWVGNTDGQGVYLRKTPVMADRLTAYPDGTTLTIVSEDTDGDGQHWKHVKAPDGTEGYVPAIYTVNTPP
jgi:hypothetical protein